MSDGELVHRAEWEHHCKPPHRLFSLPADPPGSIWKCSCGQHWIARDTRWAALSARRARRLLRKTKETS